MKNLMKSTGAMVLLVVGILFFLEVVDFVSTPKEKATPQAFNIEKIEANSKKMDTKLESILDHAIDSYNIDISRSLWTDNIKTYVDWLKKYRFFDYIQNTSLPIAAIYLLIFIAYMVQLFSLIGSFYLTNTRQYAISEWSINAPTVLGVIGTIYALSVVVYASTDISSIASVFKQGFADAAQTTILGGVVYVMNLFLNIFMMKGE